jgi:ABC-type transport system involved in multi-copper enzyme maturation permease subunit
LNAATEISLLVTRELRRSVRSLKGIILGIITLVGAVLTSLMVVWMEGNDLARAGGSEALAEANRKLLEQHTGDAGLAAQFASMPESLRTFLDITIWLGPLLIALLGFDGIAGELQHKAVRFWTVRTRRWSYFAGKVLGLWLLVGIVTLVLNLIVNTVAVAKGYVTFGELARWGTRFWFVAFIIAGAWAAIATLISSFYKQPIAALLTTFGVFFLLWLANLVGGALRAREALQKAQETMDVPVMPSMHWYEYLYPNSFEQMLLSPDGTKVLTAVAVLLGFVVVVIAGGSFAFAKRDI